METPEYGIIVHCHLRWDFVWQRPQHVMSRLSRFHPILFLEDAAPLPDEEKNQPRMQITHVSESLIVARPLLSPRTGDAQKDAEIDKTNGTAWQRLLDTLVHSLGWKNLVHWFYTPMAAPARGIYDPVAVCYDCMDELANFKGAPEGLKQKEADLMAAADVVFTGGPSMYQARRDKHANVHLFNSGVDVEHFGKALAEETAVPTDIALLHPVLLYYGVIDERMGWNNLAALADTHPDWSVVLVGPLAKITDADLLKRPNLVYTGQRGYDDLPGYLKGCDVALVPFALSDATRFLSPTKTLEYFAARKPVVSTPILDIVEHYADAARIAATPSEFVRQCEAALAEDNTARLDAGERHARSQTWDKIVERMRDLLDEAVARNLHRKDSTTMETNHHNQDPLPAQQRDLNQPEMATGQVRWYSGSRGVGVVDTDQGNEVMAFLPGEAQEDLGGVKEGDVVAVNSVAGPAHVGHQSEDSGANMFPLGLDKILSGEK